MCVNCLHLEFCKEGWHLTNFTFCGRPLFLSAGVTQNPNERAVWGLGEVCIFAHVVLYSLLAVFANDDVVTCTAVPCSFVQI